MFIEDLTCVSLDTIKEVKNQEEDLEAEIISKLHSNYLIDS